MNKEFVPYQEALALKELVFDEPCIATYTQSMRFNIYEQNGLSWSTMTNSNMIEYPKACTAPLYQQVFRWFREKYGLSSWIYNSDTTKYFYTILQNGRIIKAIESLITYEQAELECVRKLIELALNDTRAGTRGKEELGKV
jgi:hypothetical protein